MSASVSKVQAGAIIQAVLAVAAVIGLHPSQTTSDAVLGLSGVLALALTWADLHLRRAHLTGTLGHRALDALGDAADLLHALAALAETEPADGKPTGDRLAGLFERIAEAAEADAGVTAANGPQLDPGAERTDLPADLAPEPPEAPVTHPAAF